MIDISKRVAAKAFGSANRYSGYRHRQLLPQRGHAVSRDPERWPKVARSSAIDRPSGVRKLLRFERSSGASISGRRQALIDAGTRSAPTGGLREPRKGIMRL